MDSTAKFWLTGDLKIDLLTKKVFHNQTEVKLSDLSFKTMVALVKAFPNSLSNDELIEQVWQQTAVSSETVTQRVALIRKAMKDAGVDSKIYLSVTRNVGYRWLETVNYRAKEQSNQTKLVVSMITVVIGLAVVSAWIVANRSEQDLSQPVTKQTVVIGADLLAKRGWGYLRKHNMQSNKLAMGLFREALVFEESHVDALTGLSVALSHAVTKFNQPSSMLEEAKQAAANAIKQQPENAAAWAALAFVYDADGNIDEAIKGYEKAIELDADKTSSISSLAYLYAMKGRIYDALRLNVQVLGSKQLYLYLQIAQSLALLGFDVLAEQWFYKADVLSPDSVFASYQRARFYLSRNQIDKARTVIEQALNRDVKRPELHALLGLIALKENDAHTAKIHFQEAIEVDPNDWQSKLIIKALLDEQGLADPQLNHSADDFSWPEQGVYWAQYHTLMSDHDDAFVALKKSFDAGFRDYQWLLWLPTLDGLKNDQRWQLFVQTIQNDVDNQRMKLLKADWLPTSFLDPKN